MARVKNVVSAGLLALGMTFSLAACSGSSGGGDASAPAKSDAIAVPAKVKDSGMLNIATFYNYPPYTVVTNGKLGGIEVELMTAVAAKLGVKPQFHDLQFEAMIPSVVNGRNDVMIGALADTEERRKQVSFVDLYRTDLAVLVPKGNPKKVDSADLCGRSASLAAGSYQLAVVQKMSTKCTDAGKQAIKIVTSADPGGAFLAVVNGRTELTVQDPAVAKSTVKVNSDLELADGLIKSDEEVSGWVFKKDNAELRMAFAQAIDELVADGTWGKIMEEAGLDEVALNPVTINTQPVSAN